MTMLRTLKQKATWNRKKTPPQETAYHTDPVNRPILSLPISTISPPPTPSARPYRIPYTIPYPTTAENKPFIPEKKTPTLSRRISVYFKKDTTPQSSVLVSSMPPTPPDSTESSPALSGNPFSPPQKHHFSPQQTTHGSSRPQQKPRPLSLAVTTYSDSSSLSPNLHSNFNSYSHSPLSPIFGLQTPLSPAFSVQSNISLISRSSSTYRPASITKGNTKKKTPIKAKTFRQASGGLLSVSSFSNGRGGAAQDSSSKRARRLYLNSKYKALQSEAI
ncbi:hypothetical protein K504DRAFT_488098 [Pleomassaria siparia CBS 279.74]|uniref:Uncharacterized protein n=1 Tax=Pleomassaria siparia CBS 279.74 TaxID=1314801 RepID=A0A6G1KLQ9_9PLEO|nr:hypothetical protein K504DRAFT_488098 [Pleomassaria siparia CBS 279.74]